MKKQALNPYLPSWEYVPDAEPHIVDGRVYVYGSHDLFNGIAAIMTFENNAANMADLQSALVAIGALAAAALLACLAAFFSVKK
jgi:hypothetical protein